MDVEELRGQRDALRALVVAAGFRDIDHLLSRPDRVEVARMVGETARAQHLLTLRRRRGGVPR